MARLSPTYSIVLVASLVLSVFPMNSAPSIASDYFAEETGQGEGWTEDNLTSGVEGNQSAEEPESDSETKGEPVDGDGLGRNPDEGPQVQGVEVILPNLGVRQTGSSPEDLEKILSDRVAGAVNGVSIPLQVLRSGVPESLSAQEGSTLLRSMVQVFEASGGQVEGLKSRSNGVKIPSKVGGSAAQTRIVGGATVSIFEVPWQVAITDAQAGRNLFQSQFCGGSIISSRWIATAAHCVEFESAKAIRVASGVGFLPQGNPPKGVLSAVKQIIIHPRYDGNTGENDIAILELSKPLKMVLGVRESIRLPSTDHRNFAGARISGWGTTSQGGFFPQQLQMGLVDSVSNEACSSAYGSGFVWDSLTDTGPMICASTAGVDTCQGDSGGPLAVYSGSEWELAGITSFGNGCADPNFPGVYSRVAHFTEWLSCWADLPNRVSPAGGPYVCGDEAGISSGDTLRVSIGAWGSGRVGIQWLADGVAIKKANKNVFKVGSAQYNKQISVRLIDANGLSIQLASPERVGTTFTSQLISGSKFVATKRVRLIGNEKGKSGKFGDYGYLLSDFGSGYWAHKAYSLPRNTLQWTWGVADSFESGTFVMIATGTDPRDTNSWGPGMDGRTSPDFSFADGWSFRIPRNRANLMMGSSSGGYYDFRWGFIIAEHF